MILRNYKGHEIKVKRQQASAELLLKVCEEIDNFPVIKETYREILEDSMDVKHAMEVLKRIEDGDIKVVKVRVPVPSPFAHNIVLIGLSDVVLMEDRKEVLKRLHEQVMKRIRGEG